MVLQHGSVRIPTLAFIGVAQWGMQGLEPLHFSRSRHSDRTVSYSNRAVIYSIKAANCTIFKSNLLPNFFSGTQLILKNFLWEHAPIVRKQTQVQMVTILLSPITNSLATPVEGFSHMLPLPEHIIILYSYLQGRTGNAKFD